MDKDKLLNRENGFYALCYDVFLKNFEYSESFLKICIKCKEYEVRKAIDCAVNTLPVDLETCLKMRYGYKLSSPLTRVEDITYLRTCVVKYSEICKILKLDENIVKRNVAKAKQKLRNGDIVNAMLKNLGIAKLSKTKYPPLNMLINKELGYTFKGFGIFTLEELANLKLEELVEIISIHTSKIKKFATDKQLANRIFLESIQTVLAKNNLALKSDAEDNVKL